MKARVGARELKARLGRYLQAVRQGSTLVVTDRGEPVAELRPLGSATDAGLAALEALGVLTRPARPRLAPFRPLRSSGRPLSEAIDEGRADRF